MILQNSSLLFKWLWRFSEEKDEMKEVIKGVETTGAINQSRPLMVGLWKQFSKLWSDFQPFTRLKVGIWQEIRLVQDSRTGYAPLKEINGYII